MNTLLSRYLEVVRQDSHSDAEIRSATASTIAAALGVDAKRLTGGMVTKIKRFALRQAEQDTGRAIAGAVKGELESAFPKVACSYRKRRGQVCIEVWPNGEAPDIDSLLATEREVGEVRP